MKKALGGCLVVALLLLVVGGGATWWFVLRPAWNAGSHFISAAGQFADLAKMDGQVRQRGDFSPPADGRISDQDLSRFIAVQQGIQSRVGSNLVTIQDKYQQLAKEASAEGKTPAVTDFLNAYGDIFSLIRDAKQAEIDGINQQGLSLAEYRWMRSRVQAELIQGRMNQDPAKAGDLAPRIEPHRELLEQTVVMGMLGL